MCAAALTWLAVTGPHSAAFEIGRDLDRQQRISLPAPGSASWRPLIFRAIDRQTTYSREIHEDQEFLLAESNCAASGLVLPITNVELSNTPLLSWRWRVDKPLDIRDERSKQGDDFAARVYVLFRFDPSRASAFEWLRHQIGSALYAEQTPGKTLNFVWTSREKTGEVWNNPFASDSKMIALAQGAAAEWRTETVDVVDQYRKHFGSPIGELMGLAVMTDSDNSCQTTRARFADFYFSSRPAELEEHDPDRSDGSDGSDGE